MNQHWSYQKYPSINQKFKIKILERTVAKLMEGNGGGSERAAQNSLRQSWKLAALLLLLLPSEAQQPGLPHVPKLPKAQCWPVMAVGKGYLEGEIQLIVSVGGSTEEAVPSASKEQRLERILNTKIS